MDERRTSEGPPSVLPSVQSSAPGLTPSGDRQRHRMPLLIAVELIHSGALVGGPTGSLLYLQIHSRSNERTS